MLFIYQYYVTLLVSVVKCTVLYVFLVSFTCLFLFVRITESTGKSERLTIDDLNKVKKALLSARVEWEKIGLELEISAADLESIKNANRGNPDDCFIEMLKKFLKKGKPKPTWELLATTLEAEGIEYGALAEEVREKYL